MDRVRIVGASIAGALVLATAVAAPASAVEHYPVPPSNTYTVLYRGNGHGHGLSQYGARGAALQGLSYSQILSFYYQGTVLGLKSSTAPIRVRIDNGPTYPTVPAQSGLRLGSTALTTAGVDLWRLVPGGGGFVLQGRSGSTWASYRIVSTSDGFSNTSGAVAVYGLDTYRGTVYGVRVSTSASSTGVITVNTLPVESYLRGVVPSEMPSSWPAAAVQAQAVAARSYAWYAILHAGGSSYDICATTNCQVYRGYTGEQASSNDAIARTPGVVVAYNNTVAFAQFSASNGGITSDDGGAHPYFVTKADPYDAAASGDPYLGASKTVSAASIASYYGLSSVSSVDILSRAPANFPGAYHGLVVSASITGKRNGSTVTVQATGVGLAGALGVPYRYFTIVRTAPQGTLDPAIRSGLRTATIRGWSFDPTQTAQSNTVRLTIGQSTQTVTANQSRPDVQKAFGLPTAAHGYSLTVSLPGGATQVCASGVSVDGSWAVPLGCATLSVPVDPLGNFESVAAVGGGRAALTGWSFDPDQNGGPGSVQVYVDGRSVAVVPAGATRTDVQRVYGLTNAQVGFTTTVTTGSGLHTVCVYGLNAAGTPGASRLLNCLRVSA